MKLIRRFCSVALASAFILVSAVPAFATDYIPEEETIPESDIMPTTATSVDIKDVPKAYDFYHKFLKPISGQNGMYSLDVFLKDADQDVQKAWTETMQNMQSGNDDYLYLFGPYTNYRNQFALFVLSNRELRFDSNGGLPVSETGYAFHSSGLFRLKTDCFLFQLKEIDGVEKLCLSQYDSSHNVMIDLSSSSNYYYSPNDFFYSDSRISSKAKMVTGIRSIAITDDLDPSPEPLPPSPPVPPPPPYKPELPQIPTGDSTYVPYDTSIWQSFLAHIKQNMGSSTSVGFLILAAILGVLVVIKIIRKFSKA